MALSYSFTLIIALLAIATDDPILSLAALGLSVVSFFTYVLSRDTAAKCKKV
jgi:hypothetical protein